MASKRAPTRKSPAAIERWKGGPNWDRPTDDATLDSFADELVSLARDLRTASHAQGTKRALALIWKFQSDGGYRPDKLYWDDWQDHWVETGVVLVLPSELYVPDRQLRQILHDVLVALVEFATDDGRSASATAGLKDRLVDAATKYAERRGKTIAVSTEATDLPVEFVGLLQMAALVNRSKATLEKLRDAGILPSPDMKGRRGQLDEWRYETVRPILEKHFNRMLPETFPGSRFVR